MKAFALTLLFINVLSLLMSCSSTKVGNRNAIKSLDPVVATTLLAYNKDFKVYSKYDFIPSVRKFSDENPAVTSGDFNGDKIKDYAIMGHTETHELMLALVSKGNGFRIYRIDNARKRENKKWIITEKGRESGNWYYLSRVGKQVLKSEYESNKINLKTDAFRVEYYGKGSLIYFLTRKGFRKFVSSD